MTHARRFVLVLSVAAFVAAAAPGASHAAAAKALRIGAPADCATNAFCALGLRRYYGIDVRPQLRKVPAGQTVRLLTSGQAGVAVIFSTDPVASTAAGLVVLRDDRGMLGAENLVPIGSARIASSYGAALADRMAKIGNSLRTADVRDLNGLVTSGLTPRRAAESWLAAAGLGGEPALRVGPRIIVGVQDFAESRVVGYVYARGLRGAGFNASVLAVGGLRAAANEALRSDRVGVIVDYAASALEQANGFVGFSSNQSSTTIRLLRGWMKQYGLTVYAPAQARSQNRFVVVRAVAKQYGLTTLSDLRKLGYRKYAASGRVPAVAAAPPDDQRQFAVGLGDRGPDVKAIQERLRTLRYVSEAASGVFDESTRRGVVAFQEDFRLPPDGIVGTLTFRRLRAALRGEVKPTPPTRPGDPGTINPPAGGKVLYLTYGAGPSEQWTPRLLDLLDRFGAKATFVVNGSYANVLPDLLRRMASAGHAIGVTTFDYPNLEAGRLTAFEAETRAGIDAIRAATGRGTTCLRPPFGAIASQGLRPSARALGLQLALWDIDTQDWTIPGAPVISNAILANATSGDIVRLEDGGGDRSQTVVATERVLRTLKARGWRFAALPCL